MEENSFDDKYEIIGDAIGHGHFATVFKCREKSTNNFYAAKRIRHARNTLSKSGAQQSDIDREISTLKSLDHPNIIKLYDVYTDVKSIGRNGKVCGKETILILELVEGGELFKKICEEEVACETDAIFYLRQILEGLKHMHSKNIIHLDIKPENIMLDRCGENIKIIDFGLARDLSTDSNVDYRMAGTVPYFAPERINADPVSSFADMWSLGVVACILLTGINPFECTDQDLPLKTRQQETTSNITRGDLDLESEYFNSTSENGRDFIEHLLRLNPNKRMSAEDCLHHPWMADEILTNHRRRSSQLNVKNLRSFMAKERWKSAVYSIRECLTINKRLSLPTHLIDNHKDDDDCNVVSRALFSAARQGNLDDLKNLLSTATSLDIHQKNRHGESVMHLACSSGGVKIVDFLRQKGVDFDVRDQNGDNLAYWSARQGHVEILKFLKDNSVDLNGENDVGETPLHVAARYGHADVVEMLLEADCDVNKQDKLGETPLHNAVFHALPSICRKLIKGGAEVHIPNKDLETPLHVGAYRGNVNCVEVLLQNGAKSMPNKDGKTPLDLACHRKHVNVALTLLHSDCEFGESALFTAIQEELLPVIQTMCAFGCKVNIHNKEGLTPLNLASKLGNVEAVRCLLLSAADLEDDINPKEAQITELFDKVNTIEKRQFFTRQLMPGKEPLNRIKVKIFGHNSVGKTTLIDSLKCGLFTGFLRRSKFVVSTRGIDVQQTSINGAGDVSIWEFSGNESYYHYYDHFIGDPNCVHLIVFKLTDTASVYTKQVLFWLDHIKSRFPILKPILHSGNQLIRGRVALVATHADRSPAPKAVLFQMMSNLLSTVDRLYSADFLIYPNVFMVDCLSANSPGLKTIRAYIAEGKENITQMILRPNAFYETVLAALPNLRKNFPKQSWSEFLLVTRELNPLASEEHVRQVVTLLQLAGETVFVEGDDDDYVILQPRWLCDLLSTDTHTDLKALKFLEILGLCAEVSDENFEFPHKNSSCIRLEDTWKRKQYEIYGGLRLIPTGVLLNHIFSRVQVVLRKYCKSSGLEVMQWLNCSKVSSVDSELLITSRNNSIDLQIRSDDCKFTFLDDICRIVERTILSICPGCHLSRNPLSPHSLKNFQEPKFYHTSEILKAQLEDSDVLKCNKIEEDYTCVVCLGDNITITPGVHLNASALPLIAKRRLAQLLDPTDSQGRDWCLLAVELGLEDNLPSIDKIPGKSPPSRTIRCLEEWVKSEPLSATISKLIEKLLKLGREDAVNTILQMAPLYSVVDEERLTYNS